MPHAANSEKNGLKKELSRILLTSTKTSADSKETYQEIARDEKVKILS